MKILIMDMTSVKKVKDSLSGRVIRVYGIIDPWVMGNSFIHFLQGVSQNHCSSGHSAWLLREALPDNRERDKSVFVGLLDSKKAFNTLCQDGLFVKLYEFGWRVLPIC